MTNVVMLCGDLLGFYFEEFQDPCMLDNSIIMNESFNGVCKRA